jgi:hypothetical protein
MQDKSENFKNSKKGKTVMQEEPGDRLNEKLYVQTLFYVFVAY